MSDHLPQDVITNILLRLPSKSLVICTSVCKLWRSLIKDSSFIGAHFSRTIDYNNRHLLLHRFSIRGRYDSDHPGVKEDVYSLHYDNNDFAACCEIGFLSPIADREMCNECFRVVGVCNGLVCLADDLHCYGYNFLIWNPSIRKLVTLPEPGLTYHTVGGYDAYHGFAFDASTNDYKVVRLVEDQSGWKGGDKETENQTFVEVYSLAAGSWSNHWLIDPQCSLSGRRSPAAFVNGALHWGARRRSSSHGYLILAFDVGSELFQEVMMPRSLECDSFRPESMQLSVSGDGKSLALFLRYHSNVVTSNYYTLDVWVMKEYCVEESWTKLISFRPQGSLPKGLCFRKSGEVMMVCKVGGHHFYEGGEARNELVSLDVVSGQLEVLGIFGNEHYTIDPYEESIVLLDKNNAVSC